MSVVSISRITAILISGFIFCSFQPKDENNNYNYEKGIYAIINIDWNESKQQLVIGKISGKFPGMLKNRTFNIVWVGKNHGVEMEAESKPDEIVEYKGDMVLVKK
jgi:alpha-D-xyloside xylohydrolase